MAYLVRKLYRRSLLYLFKDVSDSGDVLADLPTREMKTEDGNLSTWEIQSLDNLDDGVLAIASTSSEVTKMDFIIIDTKLLDVNELDYKQTYAGSEIPVPDLQDTHYDIMHITIRKLLTFTKVFKTIFDEDDDNEKYIVRYTYSQIKSILKKAVKDNRVVKERLADGIKKVIYQ